MDETVPARTEVADFGLGCFWDPEARFGALDGVVRTLVGYAGGTTSAPTYHDIGDHLETVRVEFDPDRLSYADLVDLFWTVHDPSRAPIKRQYVPALLPHTPEQEAVAKASLDAAREEVEASITTEVIPGDTFTRAEAYHQKYKLRHRKALMEAMRAAYPSEEAFALAPAAALLNGYVAGHRSPEHLDADLPRLALPGEAVRQLRTVAADRYRSRQSALPH
jgi:peptide-methionine (S)-S-oxide reductase